MLMIILLFLALTTFACEKASSSTTSTTETTTISPLDEVGYQIEMLNIYPYFDVTINNVVIDVAYRKIYVDYTIGSFSSIYDYYFVFGFESKTFRPVHPMPTRDKKASGIFELNLLYNEADPSGYVTVEIGRISSHAVVFEEQRETNSAGFKYWIKSIQSRGKFSDNSVFIYSNDEVPTDGEVSCSIDDPDGIINSIRFVLTDPLSGNTYIDELVVPVNESMRSGDSIVYHAIAFHGLTTGMRYQVNVYVSGFDGVYEFNDSLIDRSQTVIG
jgi:hypothetical protein